jgi:flavin-dependent dehydrogenase
MHEDENVFDVAIIGGGLAGLTLAIQCIDAGYSTILFEKETYPYHKVCGEYISMESLPFLQGLGFPSEHFDLPLIKELQLSDIKGNLYQFALPLGGFGISRYTLDNTLYQIALSKGVKMHTNTKVQDIAFINESFTITADKDKFTAKIAAGTFGKRSNLDVKWNRDFIKHKRGKLNNYIAVKYHIRFTYLKKRLHCTISKMVIAASLMLRTIYVASAI